VLSPITPVSRPAGELPPPVNKRTRVSRSVGHRRHETTSVVRRALKACRPPPAARRRQYLVRSSISRKLFESPEELRSSASDPQALRPSCFRQRRLSPPPAFGPSIIPNAQNFIASWRSQSLSHLTMNEHKDLKRAACFNEVCNQRQNAKAKRIIEAGPGALKLHSQRIRLLDYTIYTVSQKKTRNQILDHKFPNGNRFLKIFC